MSVEGNPVNKKIYPKKNERIQSTDSSYLIFGEDDQRNMVEDEVIHEKILEILERKKALSIMDGISVVDTEKLCDEDFHKKLGNCFIGAKKTKKGKTSFRLNRKILFKNLIGLEVVSNDVYQKSTESKEHYEPKPLFNTIESANDLLDPEYIKNKKYHLNFWDLYNKSRIAWREYVFEIEGEKYEGYELYLAIKIFRDLGGRRNSEGELEINDGNGYSKISIEKIKNNGVVVADGTVEYLLKKCPHLFSLGLLRVDDFQYTGFGKTAELLRKIIPINSDKKDIMVQGVRYYLGREKLIMKDEKISKEDMSFVLLDNKTGGIVSEHLGVKKLLYKVDLFRESEIQELRENIKQNYILRRQKIPREKEITQLTVLNKEETEKRLTKWSTYDENPKRKNETEDEYRKRIESMGSFDYILNLGEEFRKKSKIGIHNLTWREQQWLASAYYEMATVKGKKEELFAFADQYGLKGLRLFLSVENGGYDLGDRIIKFSVAHKEFADNVFTYYGNLLDSADKAEELAESISYCRLDECRDVATKIRENLLNRAQKDIETALLVNDSTILEALTKTYDVKAKEYVALLQEVGEGKIESKSSEELTDEDKKTMIALLQENYDENYKSIEDQEFKTEVRASLENAFSNPNTVFNILRDKGRIISFNRFDTLRDFEGREVTYFGSFNADTTYSGVGSVMLEKTLKERLGDKRPMMAHCDPKQPISKKYIESGFIATGFYTIAGKPSFEIWRTEDTRSRFASKNETQKKLLQSIEMGNPVYDIRKQNKQETYPELNDGKILTRYFIHNDEMYLVFEDVPKDFKEMFISPTV